MLGDPAEVRDLAECGAIEAARRLEVQVLERGALRELGPAQPLAQPAGLALDELVLDQEREAFIERERARGWAGELLLERGGHAAQAQLVQLVKERLGQHRVLCGQVK